MRLSHIVTSAVGGLLVLLIACSPPAADTAVEADAGEGGASTSGGVDPTTTGDGGAGDAKVADSSAKDSGPAPVVANPGNDSCTAAPYIPLSAANRRLDLKAATGGATHDVDAPCGADQGPDIFYKFAVSKRVFVYADTFGASWNTVLFLLSDSCAPLSSTMAGDAVCSDDACGTQQSRLVARLEPGTYRLGLGGRGGASGDATIHFEWALAGSGIATQLPQGNSVQTGTTVGIGGNIDSLSQDCLAAGAENSYWWARCPGDQGGTLTASTCGGGTTWESVVEVQIPKSIPYQCNLDGCGLQASLTADVPPGAGLGVLSIDGQGGSDHGAYAMTVSRP